MSQTSEESLGDEEERLALALELSMVDPRLAESDEVSSKLVETQLEAVALRRNNKRSRARCRNRAAGSRQRSI